uniref:von Willebrand factor C and EGF domains n=1 Tax=Pseudonaja textilis TaxID=8673 RepID=A0A670Z378_PSETE
ILLLRMKRDAYNVIPLNGRVGGCEGDWIANCLFHCRRRIGPHICLSGFGSGCCPGWIPSPGSGQCTLPLCSFGCGSGFCIAPNLCACRDGRQGITYLPGTCGEYGCDLTCNHGGCQEVARVCPLGFSMTETANGVHCVDIDECLSASCEGLCVNTEGGFVCECGPGMQLATDRHSCQDTDECLTTPCQQHCQNSIGSYQCSCYPGFYLHGNQHSCVDVNECRRPSEKRICQHSCHNTLGSFMCSCHPGYRLSVDRLSCEGFSKSSLSPSPILQSLQQPQTLLRLSPESIGPVLPPRGSPALAPSSVPGTPFPFPLIPILSVLLSTASPTSSSPPHTSSFGTSTAKPSLLLTPSIPSACWHGGVLHEDNSSWTEPPCLNCSCEGGQVFCQTVTCDVSCSHPIPPAQGECCPTCTGCFYYGMSRVEGDVFSLSEENCTVCVCLAGNISCISPECTPSPCPSSAQTDCCPCQPGRSECHFHGQIYTEGTEFNPDGDNCTICVCRQGEVECSFIPCPTPGCPREDWLLAPGQCCFTCRKTALLTGCFIDDNGIEFPVGQLWSPGDPCELCICQADGSVSCKRTDCLEMCPHPIRIPGQCCPDCSAGCTYAGKIFYNNETFPSVLDPCLSCICLLGSVACSPVDCVVSCTYPFHPEGECCPICHDCNYKGRKVINGHNFVPEDEPCVYCTCQLGEVSCERKICPKTCTEPFGPLTHCCPDCQNNEVISKYFLSHMSEESIALSSILSDLQQRDLGSRKKVLHIILPLLKKYKKYSLHRTVYRNCVKFVTQNKIVQDGSGGQDREETLYSICDYRIFESLWGNLMNKFLKVCLPSSASHWCASSDFSMDSAALSIAGLLDSVTDLFLMPSVL